MKQISEDLGLKCKDCKAVGEQSVYGGPWTFYCVLDRNHKECSGPFKTFEDFFREQDKE